jgi:hypothetical protein
MSIGSVLATGRQGIQAGINRTAIAAGRIAGGITEDPNAASTMLSLNQGAIETKASATIVKTADEMLGSLIDIRA